MKKKLLWILLLVAIIIIIVMVIIFAKPKDQLNSNQVDNSFNKTATDKTDETNEDKGLYEKIELDDGTLYALNGEKITPDMSIGDNYFDTTITDMYLNPEDYYNKNIEVEGMYLINNPYTFVGRYSTSNLCPYCPNGYSYIEYTLDGKIDREFVDTTDWIKVIGKLEKGNDETSNYQDYYYLKVLNLELMNKRGKETVEN